jgi:hypothetical protein
LALGGTNFFKANCKALFGPKIEITTATAGKSGVLQRFSATASIGDKVYLEAFGYLESDNALKYLMLISEKKLGAKREEKKGDKWKDDDTETLA